MQEPNITHKGLFYGIIPCYLDLSEPDEPEVFFTKFWSPFGKIVSDLSDLVYAVGSVFNPDLEAGYSIKITKVLIDD